VTAPAWTGSTTVWINGQQVTGTALANPSQGVLAGVPSWLVQALQSSEGWWTGPDGSGSQVQVWSAAQPGASQAAGTVGGAVPSTSTSTPSSSRQVTVKIRTHAAGHASHAPAKPAMHRPFHAFVARHRRG
jgi:hypothetical protein